MKYGCSAHIPETRMVKEAGYDYVVYRGKEVAALTEEDYQETVRLLKDTGLPCISLNAYCSDDLVVAGPAYDREKTLAYARLLAPRAAALGVKTVGVGSPAARRIPEDFDRTKALSQFAEFLADTAAVFGEYGIAVSIEPLGYCFCNLVNRMDEALALADMLTPPMDLTIDYYNMEQSNEADLDLQPYIGRVAHVHVSDDEGDCYRRCPLLPEKKQLHQERMRQLAQLGYDGYVTLEIDLALDPESISGTLRMLKESLSN